MALGRGGMGCLRGASWLGIVAGSVASTAISALQWRHLTFTRLPATRRRYRSSLSEKRELQAGQETVMGIFGETPRVGRVQPLFPRLLVKDRSNFRLSQARRAFASSAARYSSGTIADRWRPLTLPSRRKEKKRSGSETVQPQTSSM